MSQVALPEWINKPASEASAAEKQAFVELGKDASDSNLPVMKAALMQDPGWAGVNDENGYIALHHAAVYNVVQVAKLLLEYGADVNAKSNDGWTALHFAAARGHVQVTELLLAAGADPWAKDNLSWTPLHHAAYYGHVQVAELLLAAGADPLAKDNDGWTPLPWTAHSGHVQVAELLLAAGADPLAKSKMGETPADIATRKHHLHYASVLRSWTSILSSHQELAELVTTTLRRDPTSYFSLCPLDLLEHLVVPMAKNMRGFKLSSTDAAELGADAQRHASAAVPAPV